MQPLPLIGAAELPACLDRRRRPHQQHYFAMYSSHLGGLVTDPALMLLPADDHMVHRGDGIFETVKCVGGGLYNLEAHLTRLRLSAGRIRLPVPWTSADLADIVVQTVHAGGRPEALVRILVSRGPGGFGISPAECPEPALYVVAYALPGSFMTLHPGGARAARSSIPPRAPPFSHLKSVNYLPNVLMKMEALDARVDFTLSFDEKNNLAEGATENAGIVTRGRRLQVPKPDRILPGTTARRVLELARPLIAGGLLSAVEETDIPYAAVREATELLIFGTTPDVTSVIEFDGRPVGDGKPGAAGLALNARLADDILHNAALRTPVF
ncbi:MAG TPA: aminotransferase class IV [Kiritimatiellia bacterium]|nr:aminotransferase class IV [Kiritimatiellia bacterium]HRZ12671.1 aminotransferase class IV [Kiritimatiellia bacterium]HSA19561.1 aminotransferase class IV [Kiritimatiellia bacterium]